MFAERRDLVGVGGEVGFGGEVALVGGDGEVEQGGEEGVLHRVLEAAGLVAGHRVAPGVGPFVHVEGGDVIARCVGSEDALDNGLVHPHGADGEDDGKLLIGGAGGFDLVGDGTPHAAVHLGDRIDRLGLEMRVPRALGGGELVEAHLAAGVDPFQVPAFGIEPFE